MAEAKIVIEGLRKSFGRNRVLRGIDLVINKGESLVVLGGSGSGKSVLIKHIATLMMQDKGKIFVDDKDINQFSSKEKSNYLDKIGYLFQGGALFDSLPIWRNIAFRLIEGKKCTKKEARRRAIRTMREVGLKSQVADLLPSELSGGMQKRVALARAIICSPEILFFDEPTTGLDPIMADVIDRLITKHSKELGATTITITHDIPSARKIADRVAMIKDGKIHWIGTVKDLDNPKDDYVDDFVNGRSY
jgi:phospholipid/cholesterol/gamma-HCH transport system ATP-binding protein